ncbi:MAG: DUF802 domain-containing protein [Burkholderiaceae bacterium]
MNRSLPYVVFIAGLAAVAWVGAGYAGSNALALSVTGLVAAVYVAGALELRRFRAATMTLAEAVDAVPGPSLGSTPPPALGPWLERLHPSLRSAVRRRVEGEPVGLPGPALAPYLAGLLVLLGMLGTFVGMVLTLRGTGGALASATDLAAVRASLVAPVQGLGLAFGTSVAGVATSAALGLMSALLRRERALAGQALDARIAGPLRAFSPVHQREESLRLLQRQADAMPALADRLQSLMAAIEQRAQDANAQLLAGQERLHARTGEAVAGLVASVERSLQASLAESARLAGATIAPAVEAAMAGIARETASLHAALVKSMHERESQSATRFEATAARVADGWQAALARHERASADAAAQLNGALERFSESFERRGGALVDALAARQGQWQGELAETTATLARETAALQARIADAAHAQLDGVAARLDGATRRITETWHAALERHAQASDDTATRTGTALAEAAAAFERHGAALVHTVGESHARLRAEAAARDDARTRAWTQSLEAMAGTLRDEWRDAGAQALAQQQRVCETMERTAHEITTGAEAHASRTIAEIERLVQAASEAPRAAAEVVAELREKLSDSMVRDNALLEERGRILGTLSTLLDAVNEAATQQRGAIDALVGSSAALLDRVGARFGEQVEAQSAQLAGALPLLLEAVDRAATERRGVVEALVDSSAALLERVGSRFGEQVDAQAAQLAGTLAALVDAVDRSAAEQRGAVEALVGSSATLLDRVGERFGQRVDAQAAQLADVSAQVAAGAVEVASLGEAFGAAVEQFGQSNERLVGQLQRIEGALDKSLARSDEQLAYYVAQAREVIDLSILSQKQILEDLQRVAAAGATAGAAA